MSHDALAPTAPLTPDDGRGKAPDRVGSYRVLRRLGAGGMGTVFLVDDPATGAQRALKALPAGAPLDARLRFRREGEAMARVDDHPAVVRVHSAGEADGRAYLLMDAVMGGDLHARLARGPLPPEEVLNLGRTLARGLAHVHARGVLHRDLKPHNVLFDEAGAPRLVDFGLALVAQAERLTATGTLLGTPAYMAPEQADARATDERTDVHGLGAVLYHALTGRPPFQGGSPVAVLAQVLEQEPAPPSSLVPGVPPALEQVVLRALAKAPAARFASASALADALDAVAAGVAPPRRRAPLALALGGVAALGALAAALAGRPTASPVVGDAPSPPLPALPASLAPPAPALDEARLERWLLAEDAAAGLAHLEAAWAAGTRDEEALVWAAALALAGDDAAAAAPWAGRGQGEGAAWVAAARWALDGASGEPPAREQAAVAEAEATRRQALARWQVTGDALTAVRALGGHLAPPGPAPRPIALALGIRAQRALCERRGEVLAALSSLRRNAPGMTEVDETLAAARALAPGSRPERALGVLWAVQAVWRESRARTSGPRVHLRDPTVEAWVDAVDPASRDAWVRGLHAGGVLGSSTAFADLTPERAEELFQRMEALVEDPRERELDKGGILHSFRSRAGEHRCQFALWRCWAARGGEAEAACAQALVRAIDDARVAPVVAARFHVTRHLLLGELDAAEEAIRHLDDKGWRPQLELELALLRGDADRSRAALGLLPPRSDDVLEPVVDACLRAHVAALDGRFDEARGLLAPFTATGAPRANLPWRGGPATAELVEALARGERPSRPFVRPAPEAPR